MLRAASDDDVEAYSDTVTRFIRKCVEDVVLTKTIRIYPNQKPWINSDVRAALSARTFVFKSRNTDDRKQASCDLRKSINATKRQFKNKVEEQFNTNNARSMWHGINNITGFKGNKPATVNIAASLPDELNTFYDRFEVHNTTHTGECTFLFHRGCNPILQTGEYPQSCGSGWHPRPCAQSMRIPTSRGFYRYLQPFPLSVKSSQVTFIYIALLTIQIVSKQLHNIKIGK